MAVVAADIRQPKGHIEPELFPALYVTPNDFTALDARLTQYITEGAAKAAAVVDAAAKDEATKHWAYYRAYYAIYLRYLGMANSSDIPNKSAVTHDPSQADAWLALAMGELDKFTAIIPPVETPPANPPTASLANQFSW